MQIIMDDLFEMSIPQMHEESEPAMEEPGAHMYGVERAAQQQGASVLLLSVAPC
jgi:hypothetical protein